MKKIRVEGVTSLLSKGFYATLLMKEVADHKPLAIEDGALNAILCIQFFVNKISIDNFFGVTSSLYMKLTACVKHTSLKVILCYCKGST